MGKDTMEEQSIPLTPPSVSACPLWQAFEEPSPLLLHPAFGGCDGLLIHHAADAPESRPDNRDRDRTHWRGRAAPPRPDCRRCDQLSNSCPPPALRRAEGGGRR